MMTLPIPAASAMAEPDIPEKMMLATTLTLTQPAPEPSNQRHTELEQTIRDCSSVHDVGSNDEQGNRQQHEALVESLDDLLGCQRQILPIDS